jgi:hypothetical protein
MEGIMMSRATAETKQRKSSKLSKREQSNLFEVVTLTDQEQNNDAQKVANQVKKLEDYEQVKPLEMSIFEMSAPEDNKYSNSVELYDFIPKYFWGKVERINDEFLRPLVREFECRGTKYKVRIVPARIVDEDGQERDYYPGQREELVEDALRKLVSSGQGIFLDDQASVIFTLYQLRQELQRIGHGYKLSEIRSALSVCVNTAIEVKSEDGTTVLISHIFETVGLQTTENWKGAGKKTKAFVRFNPLVTRSIKSRSFRQLNYETSMAFRSVIARQLHKRMSHHYTQASLANTYDIMLSTIIRDFGLTAYARIKDNLREVEKALEEMKSKNVILGFRVQKVIDIKRSNKLIDAKFTIGPHPIFASEMVRANKRLGYIKSLPSSANK